MVCRNIPVSVFSYYTMYYQGTQPGPYDLAVPPVSNTRLLDYGVLVPSGPPQAPIHGAGIVPIPAGTQAPSPATPANFGMYPQPGMPGQDQENTHACTYTHDAHDVATHVGKAGTKEGTGQSRTTLCTALTDHRSDILGQGGGEPRIAPRTALADCTTETPTTWDLFKAAVEALNRMLGCQMTIKTSKGK